MGVFNVKLIIRDGTVCFIFFKGSSAGSCFYQIKTEASSIYTNTQAYFTTCFLHM